MGEVKYIIASDIINVTKESDQKKKEPLNKFKKRLAIAVAKLDDSDYDTLSIESKEWSDAAIKALKDDAKKKGGIKISEADCDMPPFPEESVKAREDNIDDLAETDKGVRVRTRRKSAMGRKPKEGAQWYMKLIIVQNPNISYAALQARLKREYDLDVQKSTCYGLLANVRQTLKVLQSLNMLKDGVVIPDETAEEGAAE